MPGSLQVIERLQALRHRSAPPPRWRRRPFPRHEGAGITEQIHAQVVDVRQVGCSLGVHSTVTQPTGGAAMLRRSRGMGVPVAIEFPRVARLFS